MKISFVPSLATIGFLSKTEQAWLYSIWAALMFGGWMYVLYKTKLSLTDAITALVIYQGAWYVASSYFSKWRHMENVSPFLFWTVSVHLISVFLISKQIWGIGLLELKFPPGLDYAGSQAKWPVVVASLMSASGLFCLMKVMRIIDSGADRSIFVLMIFIIQSLISLVIYLFKSSSLRLDIAVAFFGIVVLMAYIQMRK